MEFPIAALAVKRNFYMDDFFKSVKSTNEAMEMQQQLAEMLNLGGYHLTKWISKEKEMKCTGTGESSLCQGHG